MTNKEIAAHFLLLCAKGQSRQAFELYAAQDFKHHNPYFKANTEPLIIAMEEEAKRNPTKIFEIQRAVEEGDLVAVHSHIREDANDLGVAVVHLFLFNAGKIAQLWDIAQAVPDQVINENGMF